MTSGARAFEFGVSLFFATKDSDITKEMLQATRI